ncbi:MAG: hypothetical protein KGL58_02975, partial [Pseudomonadota bacterium]|nr:hypothetical protein [Pseudomonadota bacterium]
VSRMLPGVLAESKRTGSAVVVHDSSIKNRPQMQEVILDLKKQYDFFFMQTDPVSMGLARNMAMWVGIELYAPTFICMIEDDHGFHSGLITEMTEAMKRYYGQVSPNGLRYGLFTACPFCWGDAYFEALKPIEEGSSYYIVDINRVSVMMAGGANSCFRCAPTSHWISVLRGYDTDDYPISTFQTAGLNLRNYHKGFTTLVVRKGELVSRQQREGRGFTVAPELRPFNMDFSALDPRSGFVKPKLKGADS